MRLLIALATLSFLGSVLTSISRKEYREGQPKIAPPKSVQYVAFGHEESLADTLWIRVIQDFAFCEGREKTKSVTEEKAEIGAKEVKESGNEGDKTLEEKVAQGSSFLDALAEETLKESRCHYGWVYQMLDRITDLSPRFLMAYRTGSSMLSILVDDRAGAAAILEKGLNEFPEDWTLAYRASYHYLYEMRDLKKAADMLHLAGSNGAPEWVSHLASKLYERSGQLLMGEVVVRELIDRTKDKPELQKKAKKQLEKIQSMLAKEQAKQQ